MNGLAYNEHAEPVDPRSLLVLNSIQPPAAVTNETTVTANDYSNVQRTTGSLRRMV